MKKTLLPILIISAGSIGKRHLENLTALGYSSLTVVEPDTQKINALSHKPKAVYTDVKKAIDATQPYAVFVCSPTSLHIPHALCAVQRGAHVFIEQPLSHSLLGIKKLEELSQKNNVTVMVACNFRFNRGWEKLYDIITQKKYGEPLWAASLGGYYLPTARKNTVYKNIYAAQKQGGGVILDSGVHVLDYLRGLFGEIKTTSGIQSTLHPLGIASEEIAHILVRHTNGVTCAISMDYVSKKPFHEVQIITTDGRLCWDVRNDTITFENEKKQSVIYRGARDINRMYVDELKHFFNAAQTKTQPLQTIEEARVILKLLLDAKRKASVL